MKHDCRRFWAQKRSCPHADLELEAAAELDFDFDIDPRARPLTLSTQAAVYFGDKQRQYFDVISEYQYRVEAFGAALAGELARGMPVPALAPVAAQGTVFDQEESYIYQVMLAITAGAR